MFQLFNFIVLAGHRLVGAKIKDAVSEAPPKTQKVIRQSLTMFFLISTITGFIFVGAFLFVTLSILFGQTG